MPRRFARVTLVFTLGLLLLSRPGLHAQGTVVGTLRWQLQPFCNVLTVTIVQQGAQYHIDGTDDLCGAPSKASVVGLAFPNPDGSIGFGLTTVSTTAAAPVHIDARISVASLGGPWTDSAGNTGTFVFTPGAAAGGNPRPIPRGGVAAGSIGAQAINASEVQRRVTGVCGGGVLMAAINADGTVQCLPPPTAGGDISAVTAGAGLTGGGTTGDVTVAVAPGGVTGAMLAPGAIAAVVAGFGTCPAGQFLRGFQPNGTVVCQPDGVPPLSTTVDDDPAKLVGRHPSLAIGTDGLPIISHETSGGFPVSTALRVTHCSNVNCTGATSTTVDWPANSVGRYSSLAIGSDGLPVISHLDDTAGALRVTHCSNVTCTSATSATVDDPANVVGLYTSLAIGTDGLPIISHIDSTDNALRVTHCDNVACTSATSTTVDDPSTLPGAPGATSLAIGTDGLPIISHWYQTGLGPGALRVTHCADVTCTTATSTTVDAPTGGAGAGSSLAIGSDGLPVISHGGSGGLRVTHCDNVTCTTATSATADTDMASGTSIAIGTDGFAVMSYGNQTGAGPDTLRVTHCTNVACTAWTSATVDDPANPVGNEPSIVIGRDGLPVVSHFEQYAGALRVTKCASRTCQ